VQNIAPSTSFDQPFVGTVTEDGPMQPMPPGQKALTVRLPTDTSARHLEAVHRLVWRDLLDLLPGALQVLLDQAASQMGLTANGLGTGATVGFHGSCGSDLFAVCDECQGDRAVFEVKGRGAKMNLGQAAWQTDVYRDTYRTDPALACEHLQFRSPLLVLLDCQNRTREKIEKEGVHWPLSLTDWAVLSYQEVLSNGPFAD
jgi:hypothetical protein